jgi:protein HOOK3
MTEKYNTALEEKEGLVREQSQLKATLQEARRRAPSFGADLDMDMDSVLGLPPKDVCLNSEMMDTDKGYLPPDVKEHIRALESEVTLLKSQAQNQTQTTAMSDSMDNTMYMLQSNLEVAQERIRQLEGDNKEADQHIMQLESKVEELKANPRTLHGMEQEPEMGINRVLEVEEALREKSLELDTVRSQLQDMEQKVTDLEMVSAKKDEDMIEMEGRYKKYVSKAKQAMKALEPFSLGPASVSSGMSLGNGNGSPGPASCGGEGMGLLSAEDVSSLKMAIAQKDRHISDMEMEGEKTKAFREMEERLMTVAFHSLAATLQRRSAEERITGRSSSLTPTPATGSFLSRQRQATTRRFNIPGVTQNEFFES